MKVFVYCLINLLIWVLGSIYLSMNDWQQEVVIIKDKMYDII